MEWRNLVFNDNVTRYRISENGDVYSLIKGRLLKGGTSGSQFDPYKSYLLFNGDFIKWYSAHRLVYETFVGPIPSDKEINHKDLDKLNNHYSNLEVMTHRENILHARQHKHWSGGHKGFKHTQATKEKMALAKYKSVGIYCEGVLIDSCSSIEECAQWLGTYRKKIYRALTSGKRTKFGVNSYVLKYS